MKKIALINTAKKVALVSVVALSAAPASADTSAAITSAITTAQTNMTTVTVGVLTVAAIGFGIGLVTSFLRR